MTARALFDRYFSQCPLVAIIRGVTPGEAEDIGQALYDGGIRIIEVPLNSPEPLESIRKLAARMDDAALVGAGTVLRSSQVDEVRTAGGRLIVSPNANAEIIRTVAAAGLVSCPGVFTPTEAFAAIDAGATALKVFPAEAGSPAVIKAMRSVLPPNLPILAVGGVTVDAVGPWLDAGANGFGLGSALYKPGQSAAETLSKARAFVAAVER
jgi:2-dehydro-3-deoxyphosphogalactonate aldolase